MPRNETTSAVIDGILRCLVVGSTISATLIAPNMLKVLSQPVQTYLTSLDKKARERELKRVLRYMKQRQLISENYQFGLTITSKGKKRLKQRDFDKLTIKTPEVWDYKWRLVLFDIPEDKRHARQELTIKLKLLNFQLLQQSVWIHPFPCRSEIEIICETFAISKYVTYIETTHIDHEDILVKRFDKLVACK